MKSIVSLLAALALAGCGGLKNTNPLLGLGGPTDSSMYHFEGSTQGWIKPSLGGKVDLIYQSADVAFFGAGSLGVHVTQMGPITGAGVAWVGVNPAVAPNLTGRTLRLFIYAEAASAPDDSKPTLAQVYVKDASSRFANGPGINLARGGWTELSFAPFANPTGSVVTTGGNYVEAGFDPAAIGELGIKVGASGSAGSFTYTGSFFLDGVSW